MRWATALSRRATLDDALDEVIARVRADLDGARVHLVLVFTTMHHGLGWAGLPARLRAAFPRARLVGGSGGGVLAQGQELEDGPGVSLAVASLPDVGVHPFALPKAVVGLGREPDVAAIAAAVGVPAGHVPALIVLPEPFSCNVQGLARALDGLWPHATKVGGIVSGSPEAGRHALFLDDVVLAEGAVGVALTGVDMDAVVAPGCRPIGAPMRVTAAKGSLVLELDGLPALPRLEEAFHVLDERTRRLFQVGPLVGVAVDPTEDAPRRGDFLVRQLVGVDPKRKGIGVAHPMERHDVIQFHVRDPATAVEEQQELIARRVQQRGPADAALLFTCLGRGHRFFGRPDVDSRIVRELVGDVPLAGLFCNGEVGPVHGRTWLHGYTAVTALLRSPSWD